VGLLVGVAVLVGSGVLVGTGVFVGRGVSVGTGDFVGVAVLVGRGVRVGVATCARAASCVKNKAIETKIVSQTLGRIMVPPRRLRHVSVRCTTELGVCQEQAEFSRIP
jgi:UDP-3-O-[3-hydroxymyristoyl] glucosamine N-acyltransferase